MTTDPALARLEQIRHIVVVMMENRSFDQMLGYLKRAGLPDVNGLDGSETNPGPDGQQHPVFEWGETETVFHPQIDETGKILDPCHSKACVAKQIANDNQGFIKNFLATREDSNKRHVQLPAQYQAFPMGYYGAKDLPTYDFLARNYCICDAWYSSVPGDTWPNRLFALAGRESDRQAESLLERIEEDIKNRIPGIEKAPIFDVPAFTRELEDSQWRWYAQDPATLRAADAHYRDLTDIKRDNFTYFDRETLSVLEEAIGAVIATPDSFLDDAANGNLRQVSWIDPNFIDLKVLHPDSDDDHPPSDIRAGQAFVLEVYEALRNSKDWDDTLLVVVYDEHGGFYDHMHPPKLEPDDGSGYETYGVRVPALIIGPRVSPQVSHELFDHTSLINTIFTRFVANPEQAIAKMGPRVAHARHLGVLLSDSPRADHPDPSQARVRIDQWTLDARAKRRSTPQGGPSKAPDGAGRAFALHDFQEDFARFVLAMRHAGLPTGQT
jgi:phospholipase C